MQFTWLDAKLHLINEHLIKYLFQSPPLRLLQIEGILHLRSQMSKTYTVLQNPGFPQPAYKKQFVLCSFLPRILMRAIRLLPLCRSDNYQNSYVQFLFQARLFFFFFPLLPLHSLFAYLCISHCRCYLSEIAEQQLTFLQQQRAHCHLPRPRRPPVLSCSIASSHTSGLLHS